MNSKWRMAIVLAAVMALAATAWTVASPMPGSTAKPVAAAATGKTSSTHKSAAKVARKMPKSARLEGVTPELLRDISWQIELDSAGYSPGIIDGHPSAKTELATCHFQQASGLPVTGKLDEATAERLNAAPNHATYYYTITPADAGRVGPSPKGWVAKSRLSRLAYPSLEQLVAEKHHCSRALLACLNPGVNLSRLRAGDRLVAPRLSGPPPTELNATFGKNGWRSAQAKRLEIDLNKKTIRVIDSEEHTAALFHCSVAKDKANLPAHNTHVAVIAHNPTYHFDPKKWPETKGVSQKLRIPPGPRNPVGVCWIGLALKGYGIHGTPNPELIGKTGSHGCIRLANWDAQRLAGMVRVGTPVVFIR